MSMNTRRNVSPKGGGIGGHRIEEVASGRLKVIGDVKAYHDERYVQP
jgi:hypothetical protein